MLCVTLPAARTDESEASCLWSVTPRERQELLGNLEACSDGTSNEGLLCGQECVPLAEWCTNGTQVETGDLVLLLSLLLGGSEVWRRAPGSNIV